MIKQMKYIGILIKLIKLLIQVIIKYFIIRITIKYMKIIKKMIEFIMYQTILFLYCILLKYLRIISILLKS